MKKWSAWMMIVLSCLFMLAGCADKDTVEKETPVSSISESDSPDAVPAEETPSGADGEDDKTGGMPDSRWEGQVIPNTSNDNGVTLTQIDSVAIVFQGDRAYFGSSMNNNEDIIAECKGWEKGIATYVVGGGQITFTDVKTGESHAYEFDGTTIFMGDYNVTQK